jgi:hypothetical protein
MAKEFVLKINGEPAMKTLAGIQEQIAALDEQIKTSDINDPNFSNLVSESNKAKQALGILQKEGIDGLKPKGAIDGLKNIGQSLTSIPGPIGGAISGFQGLSKAATAFVMNPIGAVITALVAVFTTITKVMGNTEKGFGALNKITAVFGEIIDPVIGLIEDLAASIGELVAGGLEIVAGLLGGAAAEAGKLSDATLKLAQEEQKAAVSRAETNKQLAEAKDILSDTNETYDRKKQALEQIRVAEDKQTKLEVANAKEKLRIAKALYDAHDDDLKLREEMRNAEIALAQVQQDAAAKQRQFNQQQKKLDAEQATRDKEAADKAKAYAAERQAAQDKIRAAEQKNLLASIKDQEERDKKAAQIDLENTKREIDRGKYTAAEKKKLKIEADEAYALAVAKINEDAAEKEKATQKELAAALINTDAEKFQQQQQQTTENYDKLIEKAKGNADMQAQLEAQKQELLVEQAKAYNEKVAADKKAADDKVKAEEAKTYKDKIDAISKTYDKEKALLEQKGLNSRQLRKEQDALELKELEEKLAATEKNNEEYYKLELALFQKKKGIRETEKAEVIDALNAGYEFAAGVANGLMELNQIKTDKILNDEKLSDAEKDKLAKEQFEKQKKLQYALAVIDGAKAVTAILSVPDFTLGVASAIRLAAAAASTAFALSKISQTQYESKSSGGGAAKGKSSGSMYQSGGILGGPSHDMGGIQTALGEVEGGEYVVNRRSTANFLPILEQINNMGNSPGPETPSMNQAPIIKTYVVASEMTNQQEADAKLSSLATL